MRPDLDLLLFTDKSKAFFASGLREGSAESSERARMELNNWKVTDRTRGRRLHACLPASASPCSPRPGPLFLFPSSVLLPLSGMPYYYYPIPLLLYSLTCTRSECNALGTNERTNEPLSSLMLPSRFLFHSLSHLSQIQILLILAMERATVSTRIHEVVV